MVLGLWIFFTPITNLLGYIPLLGGLLQGIANFVIFLASFFVCLPIFLLAICFAWLFYHPKIGIPLLIVSILGIATIIVIAVIDPANISAGGSTAQHLLIQKLIQ
jgi:hypothetical protein